MFDFFFLSFDFFVKRNELTSLQDAPEKLTLSPPQILRLEIEKNIIIKNL